MKSLKRNTAAILLGFNMAELSKLKHNLVIPEQQPAESAADTTEEMESGEDAPEPMDESGNEKVTDGEQMEWAQKCVKVEPEKVQKKNKNKIMHLKVENKLINNDHVCVNSHQRGWSCIVNGWCITLHRSLPVTEGGLLM